MKVEVKKVMDICFRVDSLVAIGTGHLFRCLTLACELKKRMSNVRIAFVSTEMPADLVRLVTLQGFVFLKIDRYCSKTENHIWCMDTMRADANLSLNLIKDYFGEIDWLIVDHYNIDYEWEKIVKAATSKIMVIDDLANRKHFADVLLDQNVFDNMGERYKGLVSERCLQLLGAEYALLREEFRNRKRNHKSPKRILVFFGGSDITGETLKVVQAIPLIENNLQMEFDVVVGSLNPQKDIIREYCLRGGNINFFCQINNMADLMEEADLAIGSGGSVTWERCCVGLPSIVIPVAENQIEPMKQLEKLGVIKAYQGERSAEGYSKAINEFLDESESRLTMSTLGQALYDGYGVERVAKILCGGESFI